MALTVKSRRRSFGGNAHRRLARLGKFTPVGTDNVYPDGSRKTHVEGAGCLVFAPGLAAKFSNCFLELKCISMHRNLKIAHCVAAGQIADGVAGQENEHSSFLGGIAHLAQCVLLIGR